MFGRKLDKLTYVVRDLIQWYRTQGVIFGGNRIA